MRVDVLCGAWRVTVGCVLAAALVAPRCARAQTALSYEIMAKANYVAAQGYYVQSAAIARDINAHAAAAEMDNAVKQVETFWKKREIWERENAKYHPSHAEREKKLHEMTQSVIKNFPQWALEGDPTDKLNWLLRELSGAALAAQYSAGGEVSDPVLNVALTDPQVRQICLTDGGRGSKFVFRLAEPIMLENALAGGVARRRLPGDPRGVRSRPTRREE